MNELTLETFDALCLTYGLEREAKVYILNPKTGQDYSRRTKDPVRVRMYMEKAIRLRKNQVVAEYNKRINKAIDQL